MVTRVPLPRGRRAQAVAALAGVAAIGLVMVSLHHLGGNGDKSGPDRDAALPDTTEMLHDGGRTWFVSATARAGGDGSPGHPFDAIQAAMQAAGPGDTVRVGPGRYPGGFRSVRSGIAQAPIRISGHRARILPGGDAIRLVEISHDHLEISGFDVVGGTAGIRLWGANHVRIIDNRVTRATGECIRIKNRSNENEVAFNQVSDCGRRNFNLAKKSKNGEGIYIGTAPEQIDELPDKSPDRSLKNWVHDNDIDTPAECVDVKEHTSLTVVEHNTCTGGKDPEGAGFSGRGDRVTFRGNTVVGGAGAGIRLGGDEAHQGTGSNVIDNDVQRPAGYGVKIMRSPQGAICGNGLIEPGMGATNDERTNPAVSCL
jgi:parallel beta-helix repeat protein